MGRRKYARRNSGSILSASVRGDREARRAHAAVLIRSYQGGEAANGTNCTGDDVAWSDDELCATGSLGHGDGFRLGFAQSSERTNFNLPERTSFFLLFRSENTFSQGGDVADSHTGAAELFEDRL